MEEKETRKLASYGSTVASFEENGKFFVQVGSPRGRIGRARKTFTYVRMERKEYEQRLCNLASVLAGSKAVRVEDIIEDALRDYAWDIIQEIELKVLKEFSRAERKEEEPTIKTKPGRCTEIVIGDKYGFTIRE